jgi:methyltransferase OMS1, mitochondrial
MRLHKNKIKMEVCHHSMNTGGKILLLEHSRSDIDVLAAYQDFTSSTVAAVGKGCIWNQQLPVMLKDAGLFMMSEERHLAGTVSLVTAVNTVS